jgi:hypothetical protein
VYTGKPIAAIFEPTDLSPAIRAGAASMATLLTLGAVGHLPRCAPIGDLTLYICDARFAAVRHEDHTEQSSGSNQLWRPAIELVASGTGSLSATATFSLSNLHVDAGQLIFTPPRPT